MQQPEFVERVEAELGVRSWYRDIEATGDGFTLPEPSASYGAHFGVENSAVAYFPHFVGITWMGSDGAERRVVK